jgi:hypothetical protein
VNSKVPKITDAEAMHQIHMLLDSGEGWDVSLLEDIEQILLKTGRTVTSQDDCTHSREELIAMLSHDYERSLASSDESRSHVILKGFKGYYNMPYTELLRHAEEAGLLDEDDDDEREAG